MRMRLSLIMAAALALAGCPAGPSRSDGKDSASSSSETSNHPTPGSDSNMSPFQQALASFRTTVASRLQRPEDQVQVIPGSEDVVGFDGLAIGDFIAFAGTAERANVRGLAAPGGPVVLLWQGTIENLDALLAAARVLDPEQSLPALDIARRLVWLHGPSHTLIASPADWKASVQVPPQIAAPAIERADDGSATLRFFMNQAGDMGLLLGYEAVARVQPGTGATWTVQRVAH